MSVNGTVENVSSEPCKREHEGDVEEPCKKLCTELKNEDVKRGKRHKYAMLLGYNGSNYSGMQYNQNIKTVESELFKAFNKVGIMQDNEVNEPYTIKFQRAARTDKAVSAAGQIVSFVMADGVCKPEDINANLPPDIRVFSFKRVTKRFNSKGNCIARTYSYIIPTHIFSQHPLNKFLESDYRITQDVIDKVNEILKIFTGSHNFHNYTSKMHAMDPRARRFVLNFSCGEPFVRNKEFIILTVKGQSFILHQIRKMIGAMIGVMRGIATTDTINASFLLERMRIPLSPGEGLFLESPHFDTYNKRYGNDGIHATLTWEDVEEEVMKFRQESIINPIIDKELEQQLMINWVSDLLQPEHDYFKPYKPGEKQAENADDVEGQDDDGDDELNESEKRHVNN